VGVLELIEAVQQAMAGQRQRTSFTDQNFRTTPRFEIGDPHYACAQNVFVAEDRITPRFLGPRLAAVRARIATQDPG
jgi:hypothetical protein